MKIGNQNYGLMARLPQNLTNDNFQAKMTGKVFYGFIRRVLDELRFLQLSSEISRMKNLYTSGVMTKKR